MPKDLIQDHKNMSKKYRVVYVEIDPKLFGKEFNDPAVFSAMDRIKQSVKQNGIVWPVCAVYKDGRLDNHFMEPEPKIGHGNSRIKAAIELGINVPVIISDFDGKYNHLPEMNEVSHISQVAKSYYTDKGYYYDIPAPKYRFGKSNKNIIISGCSFTYNSEMTWVDTIEQNYESVFNVASCAAGNDYISRRAIEKLEQLKGHDNILICQWSGMHRRAFLVDEDYGFEEHSPYVDKTEIGYWVKNGGNGVDSKVSDNDRAEKHLFEPYRKIYNEQQSAIETLEHIARTQWYCKLNNIPMLNFWWKDEISKIDIDTTLVDWDQFWFYKQKGGMAEWITDNMWDPGFADGNHPTKEQHDQFAERVVLDWIEKND